MTKCAVLVLTMRRDPREAKKEAKREAEFVREREREQENQQKARREAERGRERLRRERDAAYRKELEREILQLRLRLVEIESSQRALFEESSAFEERAYEAEADANWADAKAARCVLSWEGQNGRKARALLLRRVLALNLEPLS